MFIWLLISLVFCSAPIVIDPESIQVWNGTTTSDQIMVILVDENLPFRVSPFFGYLCCIFVFLPTVIGAILLLLQQQ